MTDKSGPKNGQRRWQRLSSRLSTKLILLLVVSMTLAIAVLGYVNIRLHRMQLENSTVAAAQRISDVIERSTSYHMLRNDREGMYNIINTIAREPGIVRIRVFNKEGRISFSTDEREVNTYVDKKAEACYACHAQAQPLERLNLPDRFRIFSASGGDRILGIINPIQNRAACSSSPCHAHPENKKILGVLDTHLSLAQGDSSLASSSREMLLHTLGALGIVSLLIGLFVWRMVQGPIKMLKKGTERLAQGELGYQLQLDSKDELGELAASFNAMSRQLNEEHQQNLSWTQLLEERVEQKTGELKRAHEHMLQVEKMASIGKLGAIVAHEINNPLAGILTYAKLLKKWLSHGATEPQRQEQIIGALDLIESESRRCGDIVKHLLMFARVAPINLDWVDLNSVIQRAVRLVQHQAEVSNVQLDLKLEEGLPKARCDAAHMEQVLVALVMNAIDVTPAGSTVTITSRTLPGNTNIELQVEDEGSGISADVMPRLFEPFFTTKEVGRGVGLGLAVSKSIVERHHGSIRAHSEAGSGATFFVTIPVDSNSGTSPTVASQAAVHSR
jgi:two-component system, NtrC family, sensor kinase